MPATARGVPDLCDRGALPDEGLHSHSWVLLRGGDPRPQGGVDRPSQLRHHGKSITARGLLAGKNPLQVTPSVCYYSTIIAACSRSLLSTRQVKCIILCIVLQVPKNADLLVMKNFLEFYIAMLGFVNFRLSGHVNLRYPMKPANPPRLQGLLSSLLLQ